MSRKHTDDDPIHELERTVSIDGVPVFSGKKLSSETVTSVNGEQFPLVDEFELLELVGQGGMGEVYRAKDLELDREVAVKVLQSKYVSGSSVSVRFMDEARITAQLQHPGIPAVYRSGKLADGRPFLAMKLIKGETLDYWLTRNPECHTISIIESIAQTIGYAHARRLIHRDIKPQNIMIGAFGEVQVMDWGLAKLLLTDRPIIARDADPEETQPETIIRTGGDSSYSVDGSDLVMAFSLLSWASDLRGDFSESQSCYEEKIALCKKIYGEESEETLRASLGLAHSYGIAGSLTKQTAFLEMILPRVEAKFGSDHPETLGAMGNLATAYYFNGRVAEAKELYQKTLLIQKEKLGEEHPVTLMNKTLLGGLLARAGEPQQAIELLEECVVTSRKVNGETSSETMNALTNLASAYGKAGNQKKQLEISKECYERLVKSVPADHPSLVSAASSLADAYLALGKAIDAIPLLELNFAAADKKPSGASAFATTQLANAYGQVGDYEAALVMWDKWYESVRRSTEFSDPFQITNLALFGDALRHVNEIDRAIEIHTLVFAKRVERLGQDHNSTLWSMVGLAYCLIEKQDAKAIELAESAYQLSLRKIGPDGAITSSMLGCLADISRKLDNTERALAILASHQTLIESDLSKLPQLRLAQLQGIAIKFSELGEHVKASKVLINAISLMDGEDDRRSLTFIGVNQLIARLQSHAFDSHALTQAHSAYDLAMDCLGSNHSLTIDILCDCIEYSYQFQSPEAGILLNRNHLQRLQSELGEDHPRMLACLVELASVHERINQYQIAQQMREKVVDLQTKKLGEDHPDVLLSMNNLAWTLAMPSENKEDAARAVQIAQAVMKKKPDDSVTLNTLGLARLRVGDWENAIRDLEKARGNHRVTPADAFPLAIAHWHLGNRKVASDWYRLGVRSIVNDSTQNSDENKLAREAKSLIDAK